MRQNGFIFASSLSSMSLKRFISVMLGLVLIVLSAGAQTVHEGGNSFSVRASRSERAKMIGKTIDPKSMPIEHSQYVDEKVKELEQAMKERDWGSEDTAWKRASELDTKDAYQRYSAMYPQGAHIAAASTRLIEIQVNDVFNSDHGSLPRMKHVDEDDDSPVSIIVVENATGQPLTVMYSGTESKSIVIVPGGKEVVSLKNGFYRIAASVPAANVRPYAGSEVLTGGRYEAGYCIIRY